MNDEWAKVIEQCRTLAEKSGATLPNVFENQPTGRIGADPWLKEALFLQHLAGFLEEVNHKQAGAGFIKNLEPAGPKSRRTKDAGGDATNYGGTVSDGG